MVGNPDFALVDEAYPYISKRLLTDESPRLREALRCEGYERLAQQQAFVFMCMTGRDAGLSGCRTSRVHQGTHPGATRNKSLFSLTE